LLIGYSDNLNYAILSSETSGFTKYCNKYIVCDENILITLEYNYDNKIIILPNIFEEIDFKHNDNDISPYPHKYWMKKEIMEQPNTIACCIDKYVNYNFDDNISSNNVTFNFDDILSSIKHLIILGCGSSYYAGCYSLQIFKNISNLKTVSVFDGSEFNKNDLPKVKGQIGILFISQSGETKDLLRCLDYFNCKNSNIITIGIINVENSSLARKVDICLNTSCGRENAVASTKVLTCQIVLLHIFAYWLSDNTTHNITDHFMQDLFKLENNIHDLLQLFDSDKLNNFVDIIKMKKSLFILGKGNLMYAAKERALKIKEIGYIHAEACSSSYLKHGPFSLIDENIIIIIINPDDANYNENLNICDQIISRGGNVISISDINCSGKFLKEIKIPINKTFYGLFAILICQMLSYHISIGKLMNPDKPKNLAKTISV
jgi:glucosamine--fructose-6-phosphate aminotransferase (isomerizing)